MGIHDPNVVYTSGMHYQNELMKSVSAISLLSWSPDHLWLVQSRSILRTTCRLYLLHSIG